MRLLGEGAPLVTAPDVVAMVNGAFEADEEPPDAEEANRTNIWLKAAS